MTLPLTINAKLAANQVNVLPQLVFTIDGIDTTFNATSINRYVKIGDTDLEIGDSWVIGGVTPVEDQKPYVSFQGGTTTRTSQQLQPDKGVGTTVTQLSIALIDKNEEISRMISPGFDVAEIMGKECKVQIGFTNTAYPEDYITIFRGVIEDITSAAGLVTFNLSSSEQKKRTSVFARATAKLATLISAVGSVSTIDLDDATDFQVPVLGPNGLYDSSITYFVKIGDEFFQYTGKTGDQLTGVTRNTAPFVYTQTAHAVDDEVSSVIRLQGNGLQLARKLMMSGRNGPYSSGVTAKNFVRTSLTETIADCIFFESQDIEDLYGITVGDYITTTGAAIGANNVTLLPITEIVKTNDGSYVVVDGAGFLEELDTAVLIDFRSRWDTLGDGCAMKGFDVDDAEFEYIYSLFLSSFDFDFRLMETIDAKTFMEDQILRPMSCFSIQRKGRISVGFHIGPIPGAEIATLNQDNILNASQLKIRRSQSRNYYNTVIFNLQKDPLTGDFGIVVNTDDAASIADFNVGKRAIQIDSQGMRDTTQGQSKAQQTANRFLNRYKRAAEYMDGVKIAFGDGLALEIGDIVLVDTDSLSVTDIKTGTRRGTVRIFQVLNKMLDVKTGEITVSLTDTNFSTSARYGLISPASLVRNGTSGTQFGIKSSYSSVYGSNEYLKWQRYGQLVVRVRSEDGVTRNATAAVDRISGNTVYLQTNLGFTPQADDIMELADYNDATDQIKFIYAFMRDTDPFDDGKTLYQQL